MEQEKERTSCKSNKCATRMIFVRCHQKAKLWEQNNTAYGK